MPQTREEFVEAVAVGARTTKVDTLTFDRRFAEVYDLLQENTTSCLDVLVRRCGFVGDQMEVSSSDYNPTLKKIGKGRAVFGLQVVHRPHGVGHIPPPGGLNVVAADITALGANRTRFILYRPKIGFGKIVKSFNKWAAGNDARCPKMR